MEHETQTDQAWRKVLEAAMVMYLAADALYAAGLVTKASEVRQCGMAAQNRVPPEAQVAYMLAKLGKTVA